MPDVIKGKASCWPIQEELNDNPYSSPTPARPKDVQNEATTDSPKSEDRGHAVRPAVSDTPKPVASEEQPKPTPVEKSRKERGRRLSHKELFVKNTSLKARKRRTGLYPNGVS